MGGIRAGNLYGTLELLILKVVETQGPLHGVAVADHIARRSGGLFQIEEGSLYPALHRLQSKGHLSWEWLKTPEGKRAKYCRITRSGRKALSNELTGWIASTRAMAALLDIASGEIG